LLAEAGKSAIRGDIVGVASSPELACNVLPVNGSRSVRYLVLSVARRLPTIKTSASTLPQWTLKLDGPVDLVFVDPITLLVSSSGNDKVLELTADGEHVGDFAVGISDVSGIIHLQEHNFTAVAGGD